MQVADDDDVADVAGADAEVSGEQWACLHVHQSSDARQSVTHLRPGVAASQQRLGHVVASRSAGIYIIHTSYPTPTDIRT